MLLARSYAIVYYTGSQRDGGNCRNRRLDIDEDERIFAALELNNILRLVHQRRLKEPADFGLLELTKHGSRRACQSSTTVHMLHTLGFSSCMFAKRSD